MVQGRVWVWIVNHHWPFLGQDVNPKQSMSGIAFLTLLSAQLDARTLDLTPEEPKEKKGRVLKVLWGGLSRQPGLIG